jgi:hypothetical protein
VQFSLYNHYLDKRAEWNIYNFVITRAQSIFLFHASRSFLLVGTVKAVGKRQLSRKNLPAITFPGAHLYMGLSRKLLKNT